MCSRGSWPEATERDGYRLECLTAPGSKGRMITRARGSAGGTGCDAVNDAARRIDEGRPREHGS
jgi:hypothetical protein